MDYSLRELLNHINTLNDEQVEIVYKMIPEFYKVNNEIDEIIKDGEKDSGL